MKISRQGVLLLMAAVIWALGLMGVPGAPAQNGKSQTGLHAQGTIGMDVSDLAVLDALGFLSPSQVEPWGRLFADETERLLLAAGDTVYVAFDKGRYTKPGDLFTVFHSSSELEQPLSGEDLGYVISFSGRVVLTKEVKPHMFQAQIVECYHPIQVGDPVIPFERVSSCVQLTSPQPTTSTDLKDLRIPVVAAKGLNEIIGQMSVVYLNDGHKQGIHRGNIFQILVRAETDQPKDPDLPDQVLGYLLILEARPATSTGIVITAKREFSSGATLKAIFLEPALRKALTHFGIECKETDIKNHPLLVLDRLIQEAGPRAEIPEAFILLSKMRRCRID